MHLSDCHRGGGGGISIVREFWLRCGLLYLNDPIRGRVRTFRHVNVRCNPTFIELGFCDAGVEYASFCRIDQ